MKKPVARGVLLKGHWLVAAGVWVLSLHCHSGGTLEGRVQGPDGACLKGAEVAVFPAELRSLEEAGAIAWARTDHRGAFRVRRPAGAYGLSASHPVLGGANVTRVTLARGATYRLPFPLRLRESGTVLRGCLRGADGRPMAGVVSLLPSDGTVRLGLARVRWVQARTGRFQVALDPGRYSISALGEGSEISGRWLEVGTTDLEWNPTLLPKPSRAPAAVRAWIRKEALPLADPESDGPPDLALETLARRGLVFGMGEATHGTRDFALLVHRTLMGLARSGAVRAFGMEMDLVEAFRVDDYIQGEGEDPFPSLSPPFRVQEVRELLGALRNHNLGLGRASRIRFYGFDMMDPGKAYEYALRQFRKTDPHSAKVLEGNLKGLAMAKPFTGKKPPPAPDGWRSALDLLLKRMDARKGRLTGMMGETGFARQRQALVVLGQFLPMAVDVPKGLEARERAMAENIAWILRQEGLGARVLLWAHNGHIAKAAQGPCGFPTLGWRLSQDLGSAYVALGTAFSQGSFLAARTTGATIEPVTHTVEPLPRGTLDAALAAVGEPRLFLDLRKVPPSGPVRKWLGAPQGTWFINLDFDPAHPEESLVAEPVADGFDALAFVAVSTPCRPE